MMTRATFALVASVAAAGAVAFGWAVGSRRADVTPAPAADRGPMVYQTFCASCHGSDGHADGGSAATLKPPPRDFASRPWRFEPTREAIRRVTLDGIPGTAMPAFRAALSEADVEAVAGHVRRLATDGPVVQKTPSEDERILAAAGFADLLGSTPPPLTLTDAKGRTVRLADFVGRLVLLHFWGRGCVHCVKEIPVLDALERRHSGRLTILHVCCDEDDPAVAQKALDRLAPGAMALTDSNGLGLARYEVRSLPTVWLIAPHGTAVGRCAGAKDWTGEAQARLLARWLPATKGLSGMDDD